MKKERLYHLILTATLTVAILCCALLGSGIGIMCAENSGKIGNFFNNLFPSGDAGAPATDSFEYIYFDLAAGNVNIGQTDATTGKRTYSGYVYVKDITGAQPVTGEHKPENKYYVYQSTATNRDTTGYAKQADYEANSKTGKNCTVPTYPRVSYNGQAWTDYIKNNTKVKEVSTNWDTAAKNSAGRTSTGHYINFASASNYTANVTIDNIWSTYWDSRKENRITGGIGADLQKNKNTQIKLLLKGDSRVGCVHYSSEEGEYNNEIRFSDGEKEGTTPGSITVADFDGRWNGNHWCTAIGSNDYGLDRSNGIVIDGGVIYAGTTPEDNCTAIGGGGNAYGKVTINGGTVTAVTSGTGTAIGGGIGFSGAGGNTDVLITGGNIFAYNLGVVSGVGDAFSNFVPAAAIGGGGSHGSDGNTNTNIKITGGTVYAQSMGGPGIGGGGSASKSGGNANITITGGTVIAKSVGGTYGTQNVDPGVSIGGGTGFIAGGSVTLNINENSNKTIIRAGSIGGGSATGKDEQGNPYKVGSANVRVDGGNIIGQVIMAGGAANPCSFTMTDGTIHSTNVIDGITIEDTNSGDIQITDPNPDFPISFKRQNGGAVFMNDPQGKATITGGLIGNCTANNGGAVYMAGGTFTLSGTGELGTNHAKENGGSVYVGAGDVQIGGGVTLNGEVLVAENSEDVSKCAIRNSDAAKDGGGVYVGGGNVNIKGGSIRDNTANQSGGGVYVGNGNITLSGNMKAKAEPVDENGKKYFTISTTSIKRNKATNDGGGMYVNNGNITINSGEINYNESANGGGMYVGNGIVTMSNGSIHDNKATNDGGGMYVKSTEISETTDNVIIKGGSVKFNTAANGGGMYVDQGNIIVNKERPSNDTTNPILRTEISFNKANGNGGGFCVENGIVLIYGGSIDYNTATENGGGMHVSVTDKAAMVDIFSGSISNNKAKTGGGVSVVSASSKPIAVTVGVNCEHTNLDYNTREYDEFDYPPTAEECGERHAGHTHHYINDAGKHSSCPLVEKNTAENNGGGFFLESDYTQLTFYCVIENDNIANGNKQCYDMDMKGGHVEIGDKSFHVEGLHFDENGDLVDQNGNPAGDPKGNIVMQDSIWVEGGEVDIYGTMTNPKFSNNITVDINEAGDHYVDHRLNKNNNNIAYKVHYYENFKGDGDTPTGTYIANQYPDPDHEDISGDARYDFTIMPAIFVRPGYKILEWNSKQDGTGDKYEVNGTFNLQTLKNAGKVGATVKDENGNDMKDDTLFILYAQWERSGYVLEFDPNVGEGETYTGTMENQRVTVGILDGSQHIATNLFKRVGYEFLGWALVPVRSGTDTLYDDEHVITEDFTNVDGATITLYAQWQKCTHVDHLVYTAEGSVLTETCSACGGHTATATLSAVNAVFDEKEHLATSVFESNWIGNKPEISYEMEADSAWDDKDTIDDDWTTNSKPVHAGTYTAKIAAGGLTAAETAQVVYTISPIKWATPAVPAISFSVSKNGANYDSIITITSPTGNNLMYKIMHLPKDGTTEAGVDGYPDWRSETEFVNISYGKYYYFYAKVVADRDHLESDPSKSSAYLATGGNIIYFKNDVGIKVVPQYGSGDFEYIVSADEGYHLRGYNDNLTSDNMIIGPINTPGFVVPIPGVESVDAHLNEGGIIINKVGPTDGAYKYTVKLVDGQVTYHQITLEFHGAAKNATVAHKGTDGQVFGDFNDKAISISRDSAFTVQFTVSDYIPEEYSEQSLVFSKALPIGTTVIMKADGKYWYYKFASEANAVDLTVFTSMGGTGTFTFDKEGTTPKSFTYQFIVDFSQASSTITDNLKASLKLTQNQSFSAPQVLADRTLDINEKATFALTAQNVSGKTATFNCAYNPSAGVASIWNGRKTALVLTAISAVPADLTCTAVIDGKITLYKMKANGQFIIPLGDLVASQDVKITLNSLLFGSVSKDLDFTAKWYVSKSEADNSPLNGHEVASINNVASLDNKVTFACAKDTVPSVRIDGTQRLCHVGGALEVTVSYKNVSERATIIAYLQAKTGGLYADTGSKNEIKDTATVNHTGEKTIGFNMGQMDKGSYRILVVVQVDGANILAVPYYFVIA